MAAARSRHGERGRPSPSSWTGASGYPRPWLLRPVDLVRGEGGWSARIVGKSRKPGQVALSPSLVTNLQTYAYQLDLPHMVGFSREPEYTKSDKELVPGYPRGIRRGDCGRCCEESTTTRDSARRCLARTPERAQHGVPECGPGTK